MTMLLNLDAGELPDEPPALWAEFDLLNVACGGHAGDAASMARLAAWCAARPEGRPVLGAHPSYPDRDGFGRRPMGMTATALAAAVASQCAALAAAATTAGVRVAYVKPHGALYHAAADSDEIARAVLDGALRGLGVSPTVIGPPRGALRSCAAALGLPYAREGFADRATRADGSLVPRSEPGAVLTDPTAAAARARALAASGDVDTICVHGDTPDALAIARAVRAALP